MKKFSYAIILLVLVGALRVQAQDQAIFTHYHISPILLNPAYAGFNEKYNVQFNFRNQWTGFPGAPLTYALNYHSPIGNTPIGIGGSVLAENVASLSRFRAQLNTAFRYQIKQIKFAAGFSFDYSTMSVNNSAREGAFYEVGDELIDAYLNGERILDASLGVYLEHNRYKDDPENGRTRFGLSFPNLIVAKISDIESNTTEGSFFGFVTAFLAHQFYFGEYNFTLEPSIMARRVRNVPWNADINLKAGFLDDRLIAGLSYRMGLGGSMGLLLGTEVDAFNLYYSFDLGFQQFQQYNSGAHEVTVAFQFSKRKNKE